VRFDALAGVGRQVAVEVRVETDVRPLVLAHEAARP